MNIRQFGSSESNFSKIIKGLGGKESGEPPEPTPSRVVWFKPVHKVQKAGLVKKPKTSAKKLEIEVAKMKPVKRKTSKSPKRISKTPHSGPCDRRRSDLVR